MSSENLSIGSIKMDTVSWILLDVAGTTTAINFVEETLFPYIKKNVEEYLKINWDLEAVKESISKFEEKDLDATKASDLIKTLTENKDANIGLKTIQGLIYQNGYKTGELKGHVYDDVSKYLEHWSKTKKVAIFSTGSIESQQLLFKNSVNGDLSQYISKYFDQSYGIKTEVETYEKIAKDLECSPETILFLTDDIKEAEAAKSAKLEVLLVNREEENSTTQESSFTIIKSFADIPLENLKRKVDDKTIEEPPTKVAKTENDTQTENVEIEEEPKQKDEPEKKNDEIESMDVDAKISPTEKEIHEEEIEESKSDAKVIVEESKVATALLETEKPNQGKEETVKSDTKKTEIHTATQTKTITNECETQTTISITATEELPLEKVQDKLMETEPIKEKSESAKVEEVTEKPVVNVDESKSEKCDLNKEKNVADTIVEETIDDIEMKKDEVKGEKTSGKQEDLKCNNTTEKLDVVSNEEKTDNEKEEKKGDDKKADDKKADEVDTEVQPKENGIIEDKPDKTEEKENISELANGKENGIENESGQDASDNLKSNDDEIKVKKIEEVESTPVSVEA